MKNVRIEILREDGSIAASGEEGEVAIQSPNAPEGYYRQPELSEQKFRHGYFWPGDSDARTNEVTFTSKDGRRGWFRARAGRSTRWKSKP